MNPILRRKKVRQKSNKLSVSARTKSPTTLKVSYGAYHFKTMKRKNPLKIESLDNKIVKGIEKFKEEK